MISLISLLYDPIQLIKNAPEKERINRRIEREENTTREVKEELYLKEETGIRRNGKH